MHHVPACRKSIVWEVVEKRGSDQPEGSSEDVRSWAYAERTGQDQSHNSSSLYVDPISQKEKKVGALIVDPCKEGICVSKEDFEYLKA